MSLAISGLNCGKRQTIVYDQPTIPLGGIYEIAWIDPRIVVTDSLITLFRAARIDSVFVEKPGDLRGNAVTVRFDIYEDTCLAVASLVDSDSRLIEPLLVQGLGRGFYKLTLNPARLKPRPSPGKPLFVRVEYCGQSITSSTLR